MAVQYHIGKAKLCQINSGGVNTLSNAEANFSPDTDTTKFRDDAKSILRCLKNVEPKVDTELLHYVENEIEQSTNLPIIIFKGSGCGCKFAAKTLFQKELMRSKEAVGFYLTEPKQLLAIGSNEKSVVLILNAGGVTKYDQQNLDDWLERIKSRPNGLSNVKIIMTVQNFKAVREHKLLKDHETHLVDAQNHRPSNKTKWEMVRAIMKQNGFEEKRSSNKSSADPAGSKKVISRELVDNICPLLGSMDYVRRLNIFFKDKWRHDKGLQFFNNPVFDYVEQFRQDLEENKENFATLLYVHSVESIKFGDTTNSGKEENEFRQAVENCTKRHERELKSLKGSPFNLLWKFAQENDLLPDLYHTLQQHAEEMEGGFLEKTNDVLKFASQYIYNSFLVVLCERYSEAIDYCGEDFFYNYIRPESSTEFPVLHVNKSRSEVVMNKFICELQKGNIFKSMNHPVMSATIFHNILQYIKREKHLAWKILKIQDKDKEGPSSCFVFGVLCESDAPSGRKTVTDIIIEDKLWMRKRKKMKWCQWTRTQEKEAMIFAAKMGRQRTFNSIVDMGADIPVECLYEIIPMPITEEKEEKVKEEENKENEEEEKGKETDEEERKDKEKEEETVRFKLFHTILKNMKFTPIECLDAGHHLLQHYVQHKKKHFLFHIQTMLDKASIITTTNSEVEPIIHRVVRSGKVKELEILLTDVALEEPLNIDLLWKGETPLLIAVELGFIEIVKFLIEKGASPTVGGLRKLPFVAAKEKKYTTVFEILMNHRSMIDYRETHLLKQWYR